MVYVHISTYLSLGMFIISLLLFGILVRLKVLAILIVGVRLVTRLLALIYYLVLMRLILALKVV